MAETHVDKHLFVIFGASGDLMRRKLLPAIYQLVANGSLKGKLTLLGVARGQDLDDEKFRDMARDVLEEAELLTDDEARAWCAECLFYHHADMSGPEDFVSLKERIESLEKERDIPGNRAFYLAIPPPAFPSTIQGLGEAGLNTSPGWTRLVIEKPFGRDLKSAQDLNAIVHQYFDETQVYRIDHYLGKETVQNLLFFRFSNLIFESLWNRDRIEHVQITVAEELGVEQRGDYYDRAGAFRDMVQNHITQLLTIIAMEVPASFHADDVREEKVQVLRSIAPIDPGEYVFGQYTSGVVEGQAEPGYLQEPKVNPASTTETFVAIRLEIANWRWYGVPFFIRTGKRMPRRLSQIVVTFRRPPVSLFAPFGQAAVESLSRNRLVITIQPDEGVDLYFEIKAPGQPVSLKTQRLHFRYTETATPLAEAYQTLLLDVLRGDQTLFVRADEVEASWKLYTPLLEQRHDPLPYAAGTWGPEEADNLFMHDRDEWTVF